MVGQNVLVIPEVRAGQVLKKCQSSCPDRNLVNRAADGQEEVPRMRRGHDQVREDEGGVAEVAVPRLQGDVDQQDRQHREAAAAVPVVAAVGQDAG